MLRDVLIKSGLSKREAEVAELVSQGLSNKEVANKLFVTEKTVKFHLTNIYKKMNVKSRAQLIVWCLPHISFADKESTAAGIGIQNTTTSPVEPAPVNTIPAGNTTVGGGNTGNTGGNTGYGNNNSGFGPYNL